jgi:RNA polymerase-interacting CarD/CdnL/TRCF family regulator
MSQPAPQMSLAVGDRVVYPNQGVCRVFGVEAKEVAGQTLTFVSMRREEDGAVVMVPTTKVQSIGLRKVASSEEVAAVFNFLKSESDKADLDWKQRARTNLDRMSQGGIQGLAEVVKGLQVLSELRPLPAKERELYDNARHLLVSEIAASLSVPECDAEDSIDVVLFPPGRERPKRTAEEFKQVGADEEGLDLGDEMLSLRGDLDLPSDEEPPPPAEAEPAEAEDEEEAPRAARPSAKRAAGDGRAAAEERPSRKVKRGSSAKPQKEPAANKAAAKKRAAAKPKTSSQASTKRRARAPASRAKTSGARNKK